LFHRAHLDLAGYSYYGRRKTILYSPVSISYAL
jgi:hypothetical protein